jgi:dipeptidyl-peptidase 4
VLFLRAASGDDPRTGLWALDLPDGEERPVVDPAADSDLPAAERMRRERVREGAAGVVSYAADDAGRIVAYPLAGRLHVLDVDEGKPRSVGSATSCFDPRPDPTGRWVAFVDGNDLRVIGADGTGERVLAAEPDPAVSWGRAEFVAAEEMGRYRGFWWAPDGEALLAARVDETPVAQWWIGDPAHPDRQPAMVRYPAAGAADADVSLWLLTLDGGRQRINWDQDRFPYLGRVSWTGADRPLLAVVSADQRASAVLAVDSTTGATTAVHEDVDERWVELFDGVPLWCDGQVVRIADRDGARRLMLGDEPLTGPDLYVRGVAGVSDGSIVFTASAGDPTQVGVYRAGASVVEAVATAPGVHRVAVGGSTIVLSSAALDTDGTATVVHAAGRRHTLQSLAQVASTTPEVRMLRLGSRGLAAGLVLPSDHRTGTRLPVLVDPYGGPHAQRVLSVRAAWLEPQWLADQGFAVLVVDGRGTPGRDPDWERAVHLDFAGPVLDDQVDALYAAAEIEPDLDLTRVGIRGWSFGGWLAALAVLRRPDVFAAGIAGAPVVDWSLYDTFYTERYLGTPQDQPEAYRENSLLDDAPTLSRPLLLIHGLADDNVVAAHTLRLSQRLTETGRPHTVLPLTGVTHMTPQESVAENLLVLQVEFLRRHLGGPTA